MTEHEEQRGTHGEEGAEAPGPGSPVGDAPAEDDVGVPDEPGK